MAISPVRIAILSVAVAFTALARDFRVPEGCVGEEIQRAIDDAFSAGGGRVVVTPGVHHTGTLRLKSRVELHLQEGAVLVGSVKKEDYSDFPNDVCGVAPEYSRKVLLQAWDAEDIAVTGKGMIDGQGPAFYDDKPADTRHWPKPAFRPLMVQFVRCRGVRLEGVTFKDSPMWTMFIRLCEDVSVDGITVVGDQRMINNDGIDFDGCRRVRVGNSTFKTGDDCLILRAMRERPGDHVVCEDVVVSNCVLDSTCQAIRMGCPSDDTVRNAVFRNIKASGMNGIFFDYPVRYVRPYDEGYMDISNIVFDGFEGAFAGSAVQIVAEPGVKIRGVRDVVFRNFKVESAQPLRFIGNADSVLTRILLEGVEANVSGDRPLETAATEPLTLRTCRFNGQAMPDGDHFAPRGERKPFIRASGISWETAACGTVRTSQHEGDVSALGPCGIRKDVRAAARKRAEALVAGMTPEERVSQLMMESPAIPRLGVKAFHWWNEALHGVARSGLATVFPQAIGLAATFDDDLMRRIGDVVSTEARAKRNLYAAKGERGWYQCLTLWSPNVNMFRDPRWGRGQETFGEDPFLTARIGGAYVRGLQGDNPEWLKTAACAKHYAVHSGPEAQRHGFDARVTDKDLEEYYLPAFRSLVRDARVEAVMTAYNRVNGEPCTASRNLLTDVLRGKWGFTGHVVSDVGAVDDIFGGHHFTTNRVEAAVAALSAGLDLCSSRFYKYLCPALKDGRIAAKDLERPLINLFTTRILLGDFEPQGALPWDSLGEEDVSTPEARALALEAAEKSLVLVKNNGLLPLSRSQFHYIGVNGPRAMDEAVLYGNYNGFSSSPSTCAAGMVREAGAGWRVCAHEIDAADVAVTCIGLTAFDEGEEGAGGDRKTYSLPESHLALLKKQKKRNLKTVAVVFGGSPVNLEEVAALADAVIVAWYPGEEGGRAIARAVLGKCNFSGRMPVTYPKSYDDLPPFMDYSLKGRTYRYSSAEPAYPFGFGLSYTTFAYGDLRVEKRGGIVHVETTVRNTGHVAGDEVAQLYIRSPEDAHDARIIHLEGFKRVSLSPGEAKTISFALDEEAFAVYGEDGKSALPPGKYLVFVGGGQPNRAVGVSAVIAVGH